MENSVLRILIVDDNPAVRENLVAVLELAGRVAGTELAIAGQAGDGRAAAAAAQALRPDVVVLDLEMPVLDGFAAARAIKAGGFARRVVVLSVHADPENRTRAEAAGADAFVVKGAPYPELLNAILGKDEERPSRHFSKGEKP
jgi:DNA-binding NarL/FixJ family response regulator